MSRLSVRIDDEDFWQAIHMAATEYQFDGGYRIYRLPLSQLWAVEDSINFRLTDIGVWVGLPREAEAISKWEKDTSHSFADAYGLLQRHAGSTPRPRS